MIPHRGANRNSTLCPSQLYSCLWLVSQHLVTIADNEFQSQPCLAICYTHNETLEQSDAMICMLGSKRTQSQCWEWEVQSQLDTPSVTQFSAPGDHCRQWIPISALQLSQDNLLGNLSMLSSITSGFLNAKCGGMPIFFTRYTMAADTEKHN